MEKKTSLYTGGWPDFLGEKNGRYYFFEIKSGNHKVDKHQIQILSILKKIGKVRVMRLDASMNYFNEDTPSILK